MTGLADSTLAAGAIVLVAGFAYAAWADLKEREVTDALWQVLGILGFGIGLVATAPGGVLPTVLWVVVGLFVIQHLFAWDTHLGPTGERYADLIEIVLYIVVVVIVGVAYAIVGIGPSAVPVSVVAVLVTVLLARGLFEAGILFGGADAKALMIAGFLVPMFPDPLIAPAASVAPVTTILPFGVTVLMNAALFSVVVPLAIAIRNLARGEFHGLSSFIGYTIPVDELPQKYVWVRDPMFGEAREEEETIETSEDDRQRRAAIAEELRAKGVQRVWVTPQIPFLVILGAGVVTGLLFGNVLFDLLFSL